MVFCSLKIKLKYSAALIAVGLALPVGIASAQSNTASDVALGAPSLVPLKGEPVTIDVNERVERAGFELDIGATSLDAPSSNAIGLAASGSLGFGPTLWGSTEAQQALDMVGALTPTSYATVNRLIRRALIASAPPPQNAEGLLAARAEALMRFGAAEEAASLATSVGAESDPKLARVAASAALIVGRDDTLCKADDVPREADPYFWDIVRAYCIARDGNPLAGAAIGAISELGGFSADDHLMLEAMLDESLAELVVIPPPSELDAPRIAMLRQLGRASEVVDKAPLPMLAGLFSLESTGAEGALVAAEKLEAAGAIDAEELKALYHNLEPALQDGTMLSERARAIAAVVDKPDADTIGQALVSAAANGGEGGFAQMARMLAPAAAELGGQDAVGRGATGYAIRDALLIGGFPQHAVRWSRSLGLRSALEEADFHALSAIADPAWPGPWERRWGDALRERAAVGDEHARRVLGALAGFGVGPKPRLEGEEILAAAQSGEVGQTVLGLGPFLQEEDPPSARRVDVMVRALRAAGLDEEARQIAIETMLAARWR